MFAVTATKCRASALPPPRLAASHSRAEVAFLSVSVVVKVFDVTMNSVVAGSSPASARVRCSGSTFDTKATSTPSRRDTRGPHNASHTSAGPRSEPPMPMFTTSRIGRPVAPSRNPARSCVASVRMRACVARTAGTTSVPSTRTGVSSCWRSAVCSTARSSERLIFSPLKNALIHSERLRSRA